MERQVRERDVMVEEEVDLRQYVLVLMRKKWLIMGLTVLAAAAAYVWSVRRPEMYQATAIVAMYQLRPEVVFAPEFRTPAELPVGGPRGKGDGSKGLLALVESGAVAQAVMDKLDRSLNEEEKSPAALIGMIESKVEGNIIRIAALNQDPEKAAVIANTWCEEYERHVNAVYATAAAGELLDSIGAEFKKTKQRYEQAEKDLGDFVAENTIDMCKRMAREKRDALYNLDQIKGMHLNAAVGELADCYADRRRIRRLLGNARALMQQIEADGGASTGSALALLLLGEKVYAREGKAESRSVEGNLLKTQAGREVLRLQRPVVVEKGEQEGRWQLDLSPLVDSGQVRQRKEAAALVQVLEGRLAELDAVIADVFTAPPRPEAGVVARLAGETWLEKVLNRENLQDIESAVRKAEDEIAELEGRIAREQARERELTRARGQAWGTYKTLAKKIDELQIMKQVKGTEVKLASRAVVPSVPVSPRTGRNVGLAGVVGLMVSCFLAFFTEFMGTVPKED